MSKQVGVAKKLDLYNAEPVDRACLTSDGRRYWAKLRQHSYISLLSGQQVEWDLFFDLGGSELPLGTLLRPGRDSLIGRATKGRPNLSVYYEQVLQGMIEKGLVEVKK